MSAEDVRAEAPLSGRFGKHGDNFHTKLGACPIMDEVEWKAVSFGMQGTLKRVVPIYRARRQAREAAEPKLSWAERARRYNAPEAVRAREEKRQRELTHPGWLCWEMTWREVRGEETVFPVDVVEAGKQLIALMAEDGCRCALARRMRPDCFHGCADAIRAEEAAVRGAAAAGGLG